VATVLAWLAAVAGLVLLAGTLVSILGTLVVPRGISSRVSQVCDSAVDASFVFATRGVSSFVRRDRMLAWQAPVTLLVRLAVWIGLLLLGYAFVLLPFVSAHVGHAFSESGSSIFTLGYSAPANNVSTVIDYAASFSGLVVVGLQIGYLPTLYSAFNRRETEVTLLTSRAGVPAWGPEILARTKWGIFDGDSRSVLDDLFDTWEKWSAEVAESHTTYLTLVRLRSPRPLSHWLTSLLAVLDAAALHISLAPSLEPKLAARLCLRMGFVALNQIASTMGIPIEDDPDPDGQISITYAQYAEAVAMLSALGYPMERSVEEAWPHYRGWRVNYDTVALQLARELDAPPALWSGPRRWPSTPIPPIRPSARLAGKTPPA
jgi:hypothetical protein